VPLPLHSEGVTLRLLRRRDARTLEQLLLSDRAWLEPWEATVPGRVGQINGRSLVSGLLSQFRDGFGLPLVIEVNGRIVGQLNVANILYGSVGSANIGYWIARRHAGRGIIPRAVAMAIDYLLLEGGLHRVEIDIRPENSASLRVVEKLRLREEGLKQRFININGSWADHRSFAVTKEELRPNLVSRLSASA
jgi:[ribosomal protein S5]-alanine N-acetyltransferase